MLCCEVCFIVCFKFFYVNDALFVFLPFCQRCFCHFVSFVCVLLLGMFKPYSSACTCPSSRLMHAIEFGVYMPNLRIRTFSLHIIALRNGLNEWL